MNTNDLVRMTVPNDLSYLFIIQTSVKEVAKKYGFEGDALYKIELALEESVSNVIEHAFEKGEKSSFDVICQKIPLGIKIIIKEKGIPFDPKLLPVYRQGTDIQGVSSTGLGMFLMKELMDEVSFHNLGPEGKEIWLIKYLKGKNTEIDKLAKEIQSKELPPEPAAITEKIAYEVHRMRPEDAIEVSKGAYKSHGYTFFDSHIYYPEQIIALNETDQMISVVAISNDGRFMGHAALVYPYVGAKIAELTFVFVNPEYRSQGCFKRLCDLLFTMPKKYPLSGIYAYAVTNHPFTQKTMIKYEINDCGIEVATSPSTWLFKGIVGDSSQRMSVVLSFKYLEKQKPSTLYPPKQHQEIVTKLYKNINSPEHGFSVPFSAEVEFKQEESELLTSVYSSEGNADIKIVKYGENILKEVRSTLKDLCLKQTSAIELFLPLQKPETYFLTSEFEKMGFFFAGILPETEIGDALILQYLNNVALSYEKIVAVSDVAKELISYIKQRDPNTI